MKNILILNLTRMGDVLMTTPLIAGLKKKYPETQISILSNSKFSKVCEFIPHIDNVLKFDVFQFDKKKSGDQISILALYRYLENMVEQLQSKRFDMLINLTHSRLSAVLTSLIDVPDVRGITSSEYGYRLIRHPWIVYFYNLINNRVYNMFHLTDIYLKSGDITAGSSTRKILMDISPDADTWAGEYLNREGVSEGELLIGFQPASSRSDRRWPTDSFIKLGNMLIEKYGAKIIIFGVESEAKLAKEINEGLGGKAIDAVGKTDIAHLAALLKLNNILITNDTGTMHIASAMGTRIIALFFSHALVHETGPYGEGHLVLQSDIACSPCSHQTVCNNMLCKEYITPLDVGNAVEMLLSGNTQAGFQRVRLFSSSYDDEGMIEYKPVHKKYVRIIDIMALAYRVLWKEVLNSHFEFKTVNADFIQKKTIELRTRIKKYFVIEKISQIEGAMNETLNALRMLQTACNNGTKVVKDIQRELAVSKMDTLKIKNYADEIAAVDRKIEGLGDQHPDVGPIIRKFLFGKENQKGSDPVRLSEETLMLYNHVRVESELLEGLVKGIVSKG